MISAALANHPKSAPLLKAHGQHKMSATEVNMELIDEAIDRAYAAQNWAAVRFLIRTWGFALINTYGRWPR